MPTWILENEIAVWRARACVYAYVCVYVRVCACMCVCVCMSHFCAMLRWGLDLGRGTVLLFTTCVWCGVCGTRVCV